MSRTFFFTDIDISFSVCKYSKIKKIGISGRQGFHWLFMYVSISKLLIIHFNYIYFVSEGG